MVLSVKIPKTRRLHCILDNRAYYLLFLQDMFPYFDKYLDNDYLPELVELIEYVMNLMDEAGKSDGANKPCNSNESITPDITEETNHISANLPLRKSLVQTISIMDCVSSTVVLSPTLVLSR